LLIGSLYLLLAVGAVAMVCPFLLMLSGSTKSGVDAADFSLLPGFLRDEIALYRKHIEAVFNESLTAARETYDMDITSFRTLPVPNARANPLVPLWFQFLQTQNLPADTFSCGHMDARISKTLPYTQRAFKQAVFEAFDGDLARVNAELHTHFTSWNWFFDTSGGDTSLAFSADRLPRYVRSPDTPFAREFRRFKMGQPLVNRYYLCVEGFFKGRFLKSRYTRDIAAYNREHGTAHASYADVRLPRRVSRETPAVTADWEEFVRNTLNLTWVRVDDRAAPLYRAFLRAKHGSIQALNRQYGTHYNGFEAVGLIKEPPRSGTALSDWEAFITGWTDRATGTLHRVPVDLLRIHSVEFRFRDYLEQRFGSLRELNRYLGSSYSSFLAVLPPQRDMHYEVFRQMKGWLRSEFLTRNYRTVMDYMVFHGRGIVNTVIYCALAVLFALIVNPMAAYAMSRYRMPSTYKILLFLMLTMAFPPMVTQIPVFLMLREFGLLNTFAALILPGLAYGYGIFLLKGFFDSLPRELYESAQMDGAGEWTMFWNITMSLSKPILSVIALQAFTVAYTNFMFALLICQDQRMWTLMPWLYQLQQRSGQGVVFASLILAAVPTFLIFVFCQKIIMRGIVVPVEK
jgi:multiple sugar transport system permease protein